jgi:hypothetical protein
MELNYCYHHSDFKFSDRALEWIKETYVYPYKGKDQVVIYDKYPTSLSENKLFNKKISWEGTQALEELRDYLGAWGIARDYLGTDIAGPDVFMFNNNRVSQRGFPHIDGYKWADESQTKRLPVLTRFNVVIEYNPDDTMFWWEDIVQGHPLVGSKTHQGLGHDGQIIANTQHLAILGDGVDDLWEKCGTPSFQKQGLYKDYCSAFLRTDCAHCVNISKPGFRLVVATALDRTLEDLYKFKGLV